MKHLGFYLRNLMIIGNIGLSLFMVLCAYSPYVDPKFHPVWACVGMAFPIFLFAELAFLLYWLFVRWRLASIPFFTLLMCGSAVRTYIPFNGYENVLPDGCIKFLSYNTMAFANGISHKKDDPNPVLDYILTSEADIVCLQEYIVTGGRNRLSKKDVAKALSVYPYRVTMEIGTNGNGLACYSRYPILSQKKLAYKSQYNGSAMYQLLIDGDTVVVINNHLESNKLTIQDKKAYYEMMTSPPEKQKLKQGVSLIVSKLSEAMAIRAYQVDFVAHTIDSLCSKGRTVIACGDFNDTPISYTHKCLTEYLHSAFVQSGNGLGISYNQNGFYFRIDNILLSKNLRSYQCKVDNGVKCSDHYPIVSYLKKEE